MFVLIMTSIIVEREREAAPQPKMLLDNPALNLHSSQHRLHGRSFSLQRGKQTFLSSSRLRNPPYEPQRVSSAVIRKPALWVRAPHTITWIKY